MGATSTSNEEGWQKVTTKRPTHCSKGHEYTPENTYIARRDGARVCKACMRVFSGKHRAKTAHPWPIPAIKFWQRVEITPSCWYWTGILDLDGYGKFRTGTGRGNNFQVAAHRWLFERLIIPVPDGFELDHLCRNRRCVNPYHLQIVTHAVNMARSSTATKPLCKNGHPYDRLYFEKGAQKHRRCVQCDRAANNRSYAKRRAT